ncbi:MAG: hypothetical protein ABII88_01295 [Candidatus Omnitrophota bacterium]
MRNDKLIVILIFTTILLNCCRAVFAEEALFQVPALIQISSDLSDGRYSPNEIVNIAAKTGFKIVIFTERDIMRWEYGIWPLRNVLKKVVENNSLAKSKIINYLKKIDQLQKLHPELVIIPGIETTPFYYWDGSILKGNLTLKDSHKHILVAGLNDYEDIKDMPVIGNLPALSAGFNILKFWPLVFILAGVFLFIKTKIKRRYILFVIAVGIIFLINNFPFKNKLFDQYHGQQGILPYQNLIDYVKAKGGLIFWAHPEAENKQKTRWVSIETESHSNDLLKSKDYTGFAVLYSGYNIIGKPGGIWDEILWEYINLKREHPVWAIAGLAFDYQGNLEQRSRDLRNMVLLSEQTPQGVLAALAKGKNYVTRGAQSDNFILKDFMVSDYKTSQSKRMGETLFLEGALPHVIISGGFTSGGAQELNISLVKNKEIVKKFVVPAPFTVEYADGDFEKDAYYRVEIKAKDLHVITNPIFVKKMKIDN